MLREQFGIQLGSINDEILQRRRARWHRVTGVSVELGDLLLFQGPHVALALDERSMLHADEGVAEVVTERFRGTLWEQRLDRVYRHQQHML